MHFAFNIPWWLIRDALFFIGGVIAGVAGLIVLLRLAVSDGLRIMF